MIPRKKSLRNIRLTFSRNGTFSAVSTVFGLYTTTMEEETIFRQELSTDELECVAGGDEGEGDDCVYVDNRDIYKWRFPNCASTVEDGSWCDMNDACYAAAVVYYALDECAKAWR